MALTYKLTLLERSLISLDACSTVYETNIRITENPNISMLKASIKDELFDMLGVPSDKKVRAEVDIKILANRRTEFGHLNPNPHYTIAILESGQITRLPETIKLTPKTALPGKDE